MAQQLGWRSLGWWRWSVRGQDAPLCFLQPCWPELQHRLRDCLRHHALRALEVRRPRTFGGLGGALDREACLKGLQEVARTELEASLLRGLLTGAMAMERTARHGLRSDGRCPH